MSKEKSDKKERKEKKSKTSEDGVKKEKKEKKEKRKSLEATTATLNAIEEASPGAVAVDADGDVIVDVQSTAVVEGTPLAALVPFANPLADDKNGKKVLKTVKKAAKAKCLKRGVKEVVKAVRKTPPGQPSAVTALPPGIVVLAADISPMDVISHIPVLCEDHNIPYVFLTSRAELGAAGSTKRPTSVVMVTPKVGGAKKVEEDPEWTEAYGEFNKLVVKLGQYVKV
ncbi:H/ACA ribonucleoprotein complex subunit 2 [Sphaceloma murrayae]|uniref:H/ACA ribonucleoprotein complex subunit 2 n=1 Tax=Sphaceloma murrayae TaxID=2082308 RepID=A0A2K1QNK4_9PEZI|nr:H/ACA ribonucleoprotein complex subunit 2 [Sphaceloma murrayae]